MLDTEHFTKYENCIDEGSSYFTFYAESFKYIVYQRQKNLNKKFSKYTIE